MKVIYIAGKFRGPNAWVVENNIRRAEEAAFGVWELGAVALCPHTNTRFFNGTLTDQLWLNGTMALLRRCDAVFLIPAWRESSGARAEREEAIRLGIPCFEDLLDLRRWLDGRKVD